MIGNAVPPILTYYVFQSMLGVKASKVKPPKYSDYIHEEPLLAPYESYLGSPKQKFPKHRKFQFSVPNLRYGSGVRFELSNAPKENSIKWSFKFFYGNSKEIKEISLDNQINDYLELVLSTTKNHVFDSCTDLVLEKYDKYSGKLLQEKWTSPNSNNDVFNFLDEVGVCVKTILDNADFENIDIDYMNSIFDKRNNKLDQNKESLLVGFYFLSNLNRKLFNL